MTNITERAIPMHLFQMTAEELHDYRILIERWRNDSYVCIMKSFIQHGVITTYDHCLSVAAIAFLINRRWHLGADEEALIGGAILHDFFLYDWHGTDQGKTAKTAAMAAYDSYFSQFPVSRITNREIGIGPGNWTHSYKHPMIAAENARLIFNISEKEQAIIRAHMWPYTFWRTPDCREAWIVSLADKYCSTRETLFCRQDGGKH